MSDLRTPSTSEPYSGDLSIPRLVRLTREAWGTNPIAIRVWRLMRRTVGVVVATTVFSGVLSIGSVLMRSNPMAPPGIGFIAVSAVNGLLAMMVLGVAVVVPFLYPVWAWRKTWAEDPMLRLADQPFRERLVGIFAPLAVANCAATAFSMVATPITLISTNEQLSSTMGASMIGGLPSAILACFSGVTAVGSYLLTYPMACVTIGLRRMINAADAAGSRARGTFYILGPVARIIGISILMAMLRAIPYLVWVGYFMASMFTTLRVTGKPPTTPTFVQMSEMFWVVSYSAMIAMDVIGVFVMHRILSGYWRRDIPLAREVVFATGEDVGVVARGFGAPGRLA